MLSAIQSLISGDILCPSFFILTYMANSSCDNLSVAVVGMVEVEEVLVGDWGVKPSLSKASFNKVSSSRRFSAARSSVGAAATSPPSTAFAGSVPRYFNAKDIPMMEIAIEIDMSMFLFTLQL